MRPNTVLMPARNRLVLEPKEDIRRSTLDALRVVEE
jgi:hypothetical protein